jgi:NADH:ubiquinone reductase (H+-translocating)
VQFGRIELTGFPAWLLWCFAHIYFLIGFKNRIVVTLNWAWSYVTFQRGARLITGSAGTHVASLDEEASLANPAPVVPAGKLIEK